MKATMGDVKLPVTEWRRKTTRKLLTTEVTFLI